MRLRTLEIKDAPFMLEWMHDESVVQFLATNFAERTLDDCEAFICNAKESIGTDECEDVHMAIVDGNDEYMGTVSLKHINRELRMAEFAITIRKCAMGQGYSLFGMKEIIQKGFSEYGLESILWCVSKDNERAVRFYDKIGYCRTVVIPQYYKELYTKKQNDSYFWYLTEK